MKVDSVLAFLRGSEDVCAGEVEGDARTGVKIGAVAYFRIAVRVTESIRGKGKGTMLAVDIADSGMETPPIDPGQEYIFYLAPERSGAHPMTPLARPVSIPAGEREAYIQTLRQWMEVVGEAPGSPKLRAQAMKAIVEAPGYFARDAARLAPVLEGWTEPELERILGIVKADEKVKSPLQENERDGLVVLLTQRGDPNRLYGFIRHECEKGQGDMVFYGLSQREPAVAGSVVTRLFADPSTAVREEAVRIAGLLRREDLLAQFEKSIAGPGQERLRAAIQTARAWIAQN